MDRRGFGRAAARAAAGAGAVVAGLGRGPGGAGVPAAHAWDEWCDTDPALLIRTPAGRLVTVYCLIGVYGSAEIGSGLLGYLTLTSTATAAGHRTRVEVTATVPCGPGAGYPTRLTVSALPLGAGTVYGQTTGTCGAPMTVAFFLPWP